ncbi:hypothetical protein [Paracidobacterium acidisoli]|uniref:Uncharacterized protein n=1 Tax=Paracidobacterium acidisoli TaxID=2303751 RepID=A0A372IK97_9BACT|nr:hypothetical protein [Paracidobacterium acidisoli]MBT9332730.1 gp58-like family protein [Paracidobacterium acidisoli]
MTENLLETIRATVQDILAPEIRTHSVRLDAIEHRIEDTKETLRAEIRAVDAKLSGDIRAVDAKVEDTKETLRAEIRAVDAKVEDTKETLRAEIRAVDARLSGEIRAVDAGLSGNIRAVDAKVEDTKETLRAEIRALGTRIEGLENLIRSFMQQVSVEISLRERLAAVEARLPKQ